MRNIVMLVCTIMACTAGPAAAQEFGTITTRQDFVSAVAGRELKRLGITVGVTPSGGIEGRAFGARVTGAWDWQDGYFCRDLYWGSRNLGPNCQVVRLSGNTIRFISDRGKGRSADLTLK